MIQHDPWIIWTGVICTLAIYSILYRENAYYRLFEHIFIGLATGYGVARTWTDVLRPKWWDPMIGKGYWWYFALFLAGLMYYLIFSRKYNWISRLIIGTMMGIGATLTFKGFATAQTPQIYKSFKPLAGVPPSTAINNFIFIATLLCVMTYFFFSFEQKNRAVRGASRMGRWLLMISFGATFGSTVMARMSLVIDRLLFILRDALKIAQ
ncbi:MAG: hypothetical protein IT210_13145 [Armatimonadetes bacterium]|nr:hypothetical protein [Armatimonadota bacterium]